MNSIMTASNKGYHVWEAVEQLTVRSLVGRIVIPPPPKRVPKVLKNEEKWFFCKCFRAFCNEEAFVEHQKSHEDSESSAVSASSDCGSNLEDQQQEALLQVESTDKSTTAEQMDNTECAVPVANSESTETMTNEGGRRSPSPTINNQLATSDIENDSIQKENEEAPPSRKRRKVTFDLEKPDIYPLKVKTRPPTKSTGKITASAPPKTGTAAGITSAKQRPGKCGYCGGAHLTKTDLITHMKQCKLTRQKPANNSPSR